MKKSYISLDGGHVVSQYLVVVLMIPTGSPYEKNGRLPMDQPNAREAPWSDDVQRGGFGAWSEAPSRKRWKRAPPQEGVPGKLRREQRAGGR